MAATKEFGHNGESTIIGPSILINGKLSGDEDLTVRGRVEGELSLTKTLIVEPSGIVKANVQVRNAIISGVVVGNIEATESVELTREGRMVGDINSPRVIIVDGASFKGRVDMGNAEPRAASERPSHRVAPATTVARAPVRVQPAVAARPLMVARPALTKPQPPSIPSGRSTAATSIVTRLERHESKPPPPPPPQPVLVGEGGKKKVLLKKKK